MILPFAESIAASLATIAKHFEGQEPSRQPDPTSKEVETAAIAVMLKDRTTNLAEIARKLTASFGRRVTRQQLYSMKHFVEARENAMGMPGEYRTRGYRSQDGSLEAWQE